MMYWLVKTEPTVYSWERLASDGETSWDGVRNFQARNNLSLMQPGDRVFIYHSADEKEIRGVAEVTRSAYPDPSATEGSWVSVGLKAVAPIVRPIGLEEIRNTYGLSVLPLVNQPRLSVMPVTEDQWKAILKYTKTEL
jgi:predicted RNA-binding protein with PUA-like domain